MEVLPEQNEILADARFHCFMKSIPEGGADPSDADEPPWIFEGIASDEGKDEDGDEILRRSLDLTYAASRGFVNWDHGTGPGDQIGYLYEASLVTPAQLRKFADRLGVELDKTSTVYVRGELYKYSEAAKAVANIIKSAPPGRGVGLSLQGALARDTESQNVLKAFVRGVAITPVPANRRTLAVLAKSLQAGSKEPLVEAQEVDPVSDSIRQYVEGRIAELRRSMTPELAQQKVLTQDAAALVVMQKWPGLPLEAARRVVSLAMKEK